MERHPQIHAGKRPLRQHPTEGRKSKFLAFKFSHVFTDDGMWYMLYGNFKRPHCPDSTVRLATSPDGLNWTRVNGNLLEGHDGEMVKLGKDLYAIYYGPRNHFDAKNGDIRVALYSGELKSLSEHSGKTSRPAYPSSE